MLHTMHIAQHHHVIILPGLSDRVSHIAWVTQWWRKEGLEPHVLRVGWHDESKDIRTNLDRIISYVDTFANTGRLSIVGTSAGGSAALNILVEKPDRVERAVNICGRLRAGTHTWRSLDRMSATSQSFKQSVLLCEQKQAMISQSLKHRIMTVSARFGDELVPQDTSTLAGAHNLTIPTIGHGLSIAMALTLFARPIIQFIKADFTPY